jgi:hypothetical protein
MYAQLKLVICSLLILRLFKFMFRQGFLYPTGTDERMRVPVPMIRPYIDYEYSSGPGPDDVYSEVWVPRLSKPVNLVNVKEGRLKVHYRPRLYDYWHTYYVFYEAQIPSVCNYWNRNQSIEMGLYGRDCGGHIDDPIAKMYGSVLVIRTEEKVNEEDPEVLFDVDSCEGFVVDNMMKK